MFSNWIEIKSAIANLVAASSKEYASETVANANALAAIAAGRYLVPTEIGEGYWPTIRFHWTYLQPVPIEIEVHAGSFELYRFTGSTPEIQAFDCVPDGGIPVELTAALDALISCATSAQ